MLTKLYDLISMYTVTPKSDTEINSVQHDGTELNIEVCSMFT